MEKSSLHRYLQKIGLSYYVRVKVPKSLQEVVGNTHIRRALHTRDLDTANRMKWQHVEVIKAYLNRLKGLDPLNIKAQKFRESIRQSLVKGNYEEAEELKLIAVDGAEKIEEETGNYKRAKEWYDLATSEEHTLDELIDMWLSTADYLNQTKNQHRKAYEELKNHLGGDCLPSKVNDDVAVTYIEDVLKKTGQAYETQRRKINSLIAFWEWMGLRKHVPRSFNPWKGFKLSKLKTEKKTEDKRAYSDEELLQLFSSRPDYPGLPDVMVLGLYTGARLEEICSLRNCDIKQNGEGVFMVSIRKSKTKAGIRTIAVAHPLPYSILKERWNADKEDGDKQLFPEFKPGGYDHKLSWSVSKAFGRYRNSVGLTGATDFHSFRRTLVTRMENLSIDQVRMARYIGHSFPTIAFAVYSGGSSEKTNIEVARSIMYPKKVEAAVNRFIEQ